MKLRKTIYPFALIISIPLVLIVFYILNQGKFEKSVEAIWTSDNIQQMDGANVQIQLQWEGFGKPKLTSITFLGDSNMEIHALLKSETDPFMMKKAVKEVESGVYQMEWNDTQLKGKQLTLILNTAEENKGKIMTGDTAHIQYKTFGITREQIIQIKWNEVESKRE